MTDKPATRTSRQLLHLVFGGELESADRLTFRDLDKLDIVGIFPDYASAHAAWRAKAQQTVDNAEMRYFVVHLHRLLDPAATAAPAGHP
ncbi:MAG TPA: DUF4170 domain-containing protein [Hyphomicrobiales bacterium]|nr:DUF4170 domain-containing protein [Hyphomicrobiales bacterium]